jgi:hypothetical protein
MTDAANNDTEAVINVDVANFDDGPPTITNMSPADGVEVSGKVTLTADAYDDLGVTGVAFFDNGVKIGDAEFVGGITWSLSWNANKVSKDAHTITCIST